MMLVRLSLPLLLIAAACGQESASSVKNTFGVDERVSLPDTMPYRAVGRLDSGCTGTLIGRRLVLTAAHCVFDSATGAVKTTTTYFRSGVRGGQPGSGAWIESMWIATERPEAERLSDWALLRLDRDASAAFGTMVVRDAGIAGAPMPFAVSVAGYHNDRGEGKEPVLSRGCAVREVVEGRLYHDCDTAAGISGAPLLAPVDGQLAIVGLAVSEFRQGATDSVHRDEYARGYANVAIPASLFASTIVRAVAALDGASPPVDVAGLLRKVNPNGRDPSTPGSTPGGHPGTQPGGLTPEAQALLPYVFPVAMLAAGSGALHGIVDTLHAVAQRLASLGGTTGNSVLIQMTQQFHADLTAFDGLIGARFFNSVTEDQARLLVATNYSKVQTSFAELQAVGAGLPAWAFNDFTQRRAELSQSMARLDALVLRPR